MSTMTEAGTATFTEIVEAMDFHLACEHSQHESHRDIHAGDAAWMRIGQSCPCSLPELLICDKMYREVQLGGVWVRCSGCGLVLPGKEWFARFKWVKL